MVTKGWDLGLNGINMLKISDDNGSPWKTPIFNGMASVDQVLVDTEATRSVYRFSTSLMN